MLCKGHSTRVDIFDSVEEFMTGTSTFFTKQSKMSCEILAYVVLYFLRRKIGLFLLLPFFPGSLQKNEMVERSSCVALYICLFHWSTFLVTDKEIYSQLNSLHLKSHGGEETIVLFVFL